MLVSIIHTSSPVLAMALHFSSSRDTSYWQDTNNLVLAAGPHHLGHSSTKEFESSSRGGQIIPTRQGQHASSESRQMPHRLFIGAADGPGGLNGPHSRLSTLVCAIVPGQPLRVLAITWKLERSAQARDRNPVMSLPCSCSIQPHCKRRQKRTRCSANSNLARASHRELRTSHASWGAILCIASPENSSPHRGGGA